MSYSSIMSYTTAKKLWTLNCPWPSQMIKQCLVFQSYTNYTTKHYFINGLLLQDHILNFVTFSGLFLT